MFNSSNIYINVDESTVFIVFLKSHFKYYTLEKPHWASFKPDEFRILICFGFYSTLRHNPVVKICQLKDYCIVRARATIWGPRADGGEGQRQKLAEQQMCIWTGGWFLYSPFPILLPVKQEALSEYKDTFNSGRAREKHLGFEAGPVFALCLLK